MANRCVLWQGTDVRITLTELVFFLRRTPESTLESELDTLTNQEHITCDGKAWESMSKVLHAMGKYEEIVPNSSVI
jgi:hypothetical protein